jgi:hypothetical protein
MKKIIGLIICSCICLFSIAQNKDLSQTKINPSLQKQYLPAEIQDLYIGMSQKELKQLRPKMKLPTSAFDLDNVEKLSTGKTKQITAQMLENKSIYEFMVEYQDEATAIFVAKQIYHTAIDTDARFPLQWSFKLADGLILKCWVFKNKLCIADSKQF